MSNQTCPNCSQPVLPTDMHCPNCGEALPRRKSGMKTFGRIVAILFLILVALPSAFAVGAAGACFLSFNSVGKADSGAAIIGFGLIVVALLIVAGGIAWIVKSWRD